MSRLSKHLLFHWKPLMQASRRQFLHHATGALFTAAAFDLQSVLAQKPEKEQGSSNISPVASVRNLGNQFLKNKVGVTGADGATSTILPSGDSLWMFGDTVEGPFKTIRGLDLTSLRSNTGAIVPRQNTSQGIANFRFLSDESGKRPRQIVPFATDENPAKHRIWAIHGLSVGQHVYLFYHRITLLEGVDVFVNFKLDGMGVARADASDLQFTRLAAPDGSLLLWKGDAPTFGVFITRGDEYAYLWGSLATGMHLARTRSTTIADLSSYEYLVEAPTRDHPNNPVRWSKRFQPTAVLFDSVPNEMSAAYNAHLRKFVAFHSLHRENKIVMRTADQITGPWSEPQVAYRPERIGDGDLIYAAKEHPELAKDGGRVLYVTFINSATYVPQMVEVTLK
jgi:hypothetical protein